jgi:fluoride ion exporter CrcB/FEX
VARLGTHGRRRVAPDGDRPARYLTDHWMQTRFETVRLLANRATGLAILNVAANVLAGLATAAIGITTASALT